MKESDPFVFHNPFLLWVDATQQAEQKEISKQVEGALDGWARAAQGGGRGKETKSGLKALQLAPRMSLGGGLADEYPKLGVASGDPPWATGRSALSAATSAPCFEGQVQVNALSKTLSRWE